MTLAEAKKRIKQAAEESSRDYDLYEDDRSKGEEFGLITALSILKHIDTEPAPKDKMTLTELAHELRKLFGFKYLTLDAFVHYGDIIGPNIITLWVVEPYYDDEDKQFEFLWNQDRKTGAIFDIPVSSLSVNLDLLEYKDADGNINYSKCIVEV